MPTIFGVQQGSFSGAGVQVKFTIPAGAWVSGVWTLGPQSGIASGVNLAIETLSGVHSVNLSPFNQGAAPWSSTANATAGQMADINAGAGGAAITVAVEGNYAVGPSPIVVYTLQLMGPSGSGGGGGNISSVKKPFSVIPPIGVKVL